jgi:nuclear transport factor 2 (NTF2) superfamily protein
VMPHLGYCTKREMVSGLRAFLAGKWQIDDEQRRGIKKLRAERANEYAIRYWQENEHKKRKSTSTSEYEDLKREIAPLRATESAQIQEGGISTPQTAGGI